MKIGINHKNGVKCLEPTKTIPCCAFKIDKYIYMHVPVCAQINTFTISCTMLEFSREMARHVRDFETSGSTQKTTKNKHTVQTRLCHVLCLLVSLVIPHLCWGWKSTRNGLFTAYTWQIVKIGINHKHVVKCLEPTKTIPCCAFKIDK